MSIGIKAASFLNRFLLRLFLNFEKRPTTLFNSKANKQKIAKKAKFGERSTRHSFAIAYSQVIISRCSRVCLNVAGSGPICALPNI